MKNLTKRFVSLLMCFLMLVMLLPTTAVAAGTFDVSAGKVSAENTVGAKTDVPIMLDNNPGVTAVKIRFEKDQLKLVAVKEQEATISGWKGYTKDFNTANSKGEYTLFWANSLIGEDITATGKLVTLTFEVLAGATAGSKEITLTPSADDIINNNDEVVTATATNGSITLLAAPISSVTASVDAPVKGVALDTTVDLGGTTAYTGTVDWYKGNTATGTAVTGSAAANQVYTAKITLTAKTGESFAKSLNNTTTTEGYKVVGTDATHLTLTKTFPATAEKTLTGITIKTCPHTTYTAGEQFNKAGMVITAQYDDGSTKDVQPTYFQFTPVDPLTVNNKEVTISYTEGNVTKTAKQKITVNPKALTANMVQPIASQPYTGSAIEPTVTVNVGKKTLTAGTDYTVTYKDNTNVGTAKVIVTGTGNYTGSVETKFNITAKALTASMVQDIAAQTYTGSPIVPKLTVKDGETALSKDTDYTVKYQNNLNAGTATVTLTGKGNYSDSVSKTFTIKQKDVTAQRDATDIQVVVDKGTFDAPTFGDVTGTLTYSYDGATSYDAIVKKLETLQLGATGDIGYAYTANGNYTGTITGKLHFTVVNLPAATITTAPAAKTGLTFNGTEQVLVNAGSGITGGTLQYKLDGGSYNAELPKATNAGSYTVYYKVKGNNTTHSDSSEQSFTVTIAPKTVTAAVSVEHLHGRGDCADDCDSEGWYDCHSCQ